MKRISLCVCVETGENNKKVVSEIDSKRKTKHETPH